MTDLGFTRSVRRLGWIGWAVIAVLVAGTTVSVASTGNGNGPPSNPGHPITVTGTSPTGLAPGQTQPLLVTITNPNNQPAQVTSVTVAVGDASTSCPATGNITATGYDSKKKGALVYTAPKNGSVQVPLSITMLNQNKSQNDCKSVSFPLTFTATLTSNS